MNSIKFYLILFIIFSKITSTYSEVLQNYIGSSVIETDSVYIYAEEMPEFPGGLNKLNEFISQNVIYPENALNKGIKGRVLVYLIVEKDGSVSNVRIAKGVDPELDAEAIRVVETLPKWIPGKHHGEIVRVNTIVSINFVLEIEMPQIPLYEDETDDFDPAAYSMLDEMPKFPGGAEKLIEFINQNLKYPENSKKQDIQETVFVSFIINTDGVISNVEIVKGVDTEIDNEVIRVVELMPKWSPGKLRGQIVPVEFILTVNFGESERIIPHDSKVYYFVDKMPKFPGGSEKLFDFFYDNLIYPVNAQKQRVSGTVMVYFVVEKDGSISEVEIIKCADPELDSESVRFIKSMPKWIPGSHKGELVRVNYVIPVEFSIDPLPQDDDTDNIFVYEIVDEMPEFPGGLEKLLQFLASNVKYPAKEQEKGIQGKVIVGFVVGTDGSIKNVKILKSVNLELDAEALRVVKLMPKWKPGRQKGKLVNVQYVVPINFEIR